MSTEEGKKEWKKLKKIHIFLQNDRKALLFRDKLWEILIEPNGHDRSCVYFSSTKIGSCDCDLSVEYEEILEAYATLALNL